MSFLLKISENIDNVITYIDKYEKAIDAAEETLAYDGRKIEDICKNLPLITHKYKSYAAELKSLQEYLEFKREEVEGKKWKGFNEGYSRQLSAKDISQYIKGDKDYVHHTELILEVIHLRSQMNAVLDGIECLHWQSSNIVKLRVASLEEAVL